jgi:hypothetical protein
MTVDVSLYPRRKARPYERGNAVEVKGILALQKKIIFL